MRIVHVILTNRFAGSERYAIELANAQSASHDVTLILRRTAHRDRPTGYSHKVDPRVKILWVGRWLGRWQARRWIRRLRPDVAHAHLSDGCKALGGLQDLRGTVLRVATLHMRYKPQQHQNLDALVAIAPWQLQEVPSQLRAHTVHINNWTLPYAPSPGARALMRARHGIAEDAWVLGSVGRVEHTKGLDVLLDAFEMAALPGACLVIVGQGGEVEALKQRKVPGVLFVGFAEKPQDWLAAFDVFVSSAREESFGLVMLEAAAAGLPIIATATEGARHLADDVVETIVPLEDPAALAKALRDAFEERPLRRQKDLRKYAVETSVAEIFSFYQRERSVVVKEGA